MKTLGWNVQNRVPRLFEYAEWAPNIAVLQGQLMVGDILVDAVPPPFNPGWYRIVSIEPHLMAEHFPDMRAFVLRPLPDDKWGWSYVGIGSIKRAWQIEPPALGLNVIVKILGKSIGSIDYDYLDVHHQGRFGIVIAVARPGDAKWTEIANWIGTHAGNRAYGQVPAGEPVYVVQDRDSLDNVSYFLAKDLEPVGMVEANQKLAWDVQKYLYIKDWHDAGDPHDVPVGTVLLSGSKEETTPDNLRSSWTVVWSWPLVIKGGPHLMVWHEEGQTWLEVADEEEFERIKQQSTTAGLKLTWQVKEYPRYLGDWLRDRIHDLPIGHVLIAGSSREPHPDEPAHRYIVRWPWPMVIENEEDHSLRRWATGTWELIGPETLEELKREATASLKLSWQVEAPKSSFTEPELGDSVEIVYGVEDWRRLLTGLGVTDDEDRPFTTPAIRLRFLHAEGRIREIEGYFEDPDKEPVYYIDFDSSYLADLMNGWRWSREEFQLLDRPDTTASLKLAWQLGPEEGTQVNNARELLPLIGPDQIWETGVGGSFLLIGSELLEPPRLISLQDLGTTFPKFRGTVDHYITVENFPPETMVVVLPEGRATWTGDIETDNLLEEAVIVSPNIYPLMYWGPRPESKRRGEEFLEASLKLGWEVEPAPPQVGDIVTFRVGNFALLREINISPEEADAELISPSYRYRVVKVEPESPTWQHYKQESFADVSDVPDFGLGAIVMVNAQAIEGEVPEVMWEIPLSHWQRYIRKR